MRIRVFSLLALALGSFVFFACGSSRETFLAVDESAGTFASDRPEAGPAPLCPSNQCLPHHLDCNGAVPDGCEANIRSDKKNCGGCGNVCASADGGLPPFSIAACVNGGCDFLCIADPFQGPMRNCDGPDPMRGDPVRGCPNAILCDPMNCGACGVLPPLDSTGDRICMLGTPLPGCPTGLTNCRVGSCGQQCKDLNHDAKNCGVCGRECPDPSIASATVDALKAKHIAYSCNGPSPDGGLPSCIPVCETDYPSPAGPPHIYKDCDGDFDQTIADPTNPAFNGCEIETFHNKDQCGACTKKCDLVCHTKKGTIIDQVCDCAAGLTWCPAIEECVDLNNDAKNCGACGNLCPGPSTADDNGRPICTGGKCGYKCRAGYADCNGKIADGCEVDTQNFHESCGSCGHKCMTDQRCGNGECQTEDCSGPTKN